MGHFHLVDGVPLWVKALAAAAFALGMFHGWLERRRRSSRIVRDSR